MNRSGLRSRRTTVGKLMVTVAAIGLVVSLVGTVVAWQLVGQLNSSTRRSLDVTIETIDSVAATIDVADRVLAATTDSIASAASSLTALADSFETTNGVLAEIDDLTTVVGPALEDAGSALGELEDLGTGIDNVLGGLSEIPFGPDYDPDKGLGETIGEIAATLEDLPGEFQETSTELGEFSTSLDELEDEIVVLAADVEEVSSELAGSDLLVDQYRTNIGDAREVAVETRDGLDRDVTLMRIVLLIGGLNLALGQIVPYWLGRSLLDASRDGTKPETAITAG
ncbi:hypothetical protein [Ilumatobacter nonamiensis]|uniref:hypothetical protein n=1 Tax=Ilumatobacter nonamiensis TaxID=467093 RepID=UPI00058DFF4C|nr:hypothetical protein [Ilumatobacter nonamiensis]